MTESPSKQNRSRSHTKPQKKRVPFPKLFRLFAKQTLTALVCAVVILGAHHMADEPFSGYTDALGQALRFETDLTALKDSGAGVLDWLHNRFSQRTEMNDHE